MRVDGRNKNNYCAVLTFPGGFRVKLCFTN